MTSIVAMWLLFTVSSSSLFAQTTYSEEEEEMLHFVNNGWAYAVKYDSLERIQPVLDSCARFLKRFPYSFAKPNVYAFMLKMTAMISTSKELIFPLVDSVLAYDKLPETRMGIGELLVEREIDLKLGSRLLEEALPSLTVAYHRYKTHLMLSRVALSRGDFVSADQHIKRALEIDSTRLDAWYAQLGYSQIRELPEESRRITQRISELLNRRSERYKTYLDNNEFVGQSINNLRSYDLDSNQVELNRFGGQIILIQEFNFWCGVPELEFPAIKRMTQEFPQVKYIFLNAGETPEEIKSRYFAKPSTKFLKRHTILFPDSTIGQFFSGTMVMGTIFLVDSRGTIRYTFPGNTRELEKLLREKIRLLLHENGSK